MGLQKQIEPNLTPNGGEECIGLFLLNDGSNRIQCEWLNVDPLGCIGIGHDCGRV